MNTPVGTCVDKHFITMEIPTNILAPLKKREVKVSEDPVKRRLTIKVIFHAPRFVD